MPKRILIVDDDPAQRRILEEIIKRLGYDTQLAKSGEEAIEVLKDDAASSISLVLLDLIMP
ncbi:MAG: response regulator, partial [Pseudomonadota bacterium]